MKFTRYPLLAGIALALSLTLTGCETMQHAAATDAQVEREHDSLKTQMTVPADTQPYSDIVRYRTEQYVSLEPVEIKHADGTGNRVHLGCHIAIATDAPISLLEAVQLITRECKVQVRVTQDALAQIASAGNVNMKAGAPGQPAGIGAPGQGSVVPAIGAGGMGAMASPSYAGSLGDNGLIDVNFDGEGEDFLDMLTARMGGLSWKKLDNGSIKIYALDTKTFAISALATDDTTMNSNFQSGTTMSNGATTSTVGGSGGSGGGGGSGGNSAGQGTNTTMQETVIKMKTNLWNEIQKALDTIAGPGNTAVTPSMGSVTIRGNIDTLDAAENFVNYQNKRLEKGVTFNIKVYSVTLTNSDAAGINWNAMYNSLKFGASLTGGFIAPQNAISAGFSVLKNSGSPWAGTEAIISALNQQGRTKLEREQNLPTLNFAPVATQVGTQQGYLAGEQQTQTSNVGSQTSIQLGTINVGFNVSLMPYIQDNNNILVQFNLNLSSLDSIRPIDAGNAKAEAPNINLPLNTVQKVKVTPGDTLVLTGINNVDDSSTRTGTGWHWNWVLGGGANASKSNTVLLVLITPILRD